MNKKLQLFFVVLLILIAVGAIIFFVGRDKPTEQKFISSDPLNASYLIDGGQIMLKNGQADVGTTHTAVFGQPVSGDLNGDGRVDAALILTRDTGGSGTFFYVAAAINTTSGAQGTNAVLLGDRIAPQNINIQDQQIIVNYADRQAGEPMTTPPSMGVSLYLTVDKGELKRTLAPTQVISYLVSTEDPTKYCNGDNMDSAGYRETITIPKSTSTPELAPTKLQIIKATIDAATTGMCRDAMDQLDITENNGTVYIPPIDAWAGVSIVMCYCKPQVEVNVLHIPGIKDVVW